MSGSESGSDNGGRVGSQNYGKLASKTLVLETKRFYLDVKENKRGRFIKIAEVGRSDGRKNQIMMSLRAAAQFRQHLVSMIEFIHDLEPVDPSNLRQNELKSESMAKDDKKYHLDLKENSRGRFLKVTETFTRAYARFQIFIPAEGMEELNQLLRELIEDYDDVDQEEPPKGPGDRSLKIENKNFFWSCKKNSQGRYISISEVKSGYRNSILIPETGWDDFRDMMDSFFEDCKTHD